MFPGIVGLVFAIDLQGNCRKYDFYTLTEDGENAVSRCSRFKNVAHVLHEECNSEMFYESTMGSVTLVEDLPWEARGKP